MKKYRRLNEGMLWIAHGEELTKEELGKRAGGWIQNKWDGSVESFNARFLGIKLEIVETEEEAK